MPDLLVAKQDGGDVLVRVRAQPRARENAVAGVRDGALVVRVTAPQEGGRANEAILRVLARRVGIPPSRATIERGSSGRDKLVRLRDTSAAAVEARLTPP